MPIASLSRSASPKYSIDLNKINDMSNCYAHRNKKFRLKDLQPKLQHQSQQCKGVGNEVACLMITLSYVSIEMVKGIYFRMKILDA